MVSRDVLTTGRAATAAGVLAVVGVEGEWLLDPQRDDGTITNTPVFVLLLGTATVGFTLLLVAVRGLRRESVQEQVQPTWPARAGAAMTTAGAGLLTAFGLGALVSGVIRGAPLELTFLAFALGMLLLSVGPVLWGLALRRQSPAPGVWQTLVLGGAAAFAAIAIEPDPWHDVALVAAFAAWSAIGVLLLRGRAVSDRASRVQARSGVWPRARESRQCAESRTDMDTPVTPGVWTRYGTVLPPAEWGGRCRPVPPVRVWPGARAAYAP